MCSDKILAIQNQKNLIYKDKELLRDIELFTLSYLLILQLLITNKQSNYSVPTMTLHGGSIHIFYLTAPITKELHVYLHFM